LNLRVTASCLRDEFGYAGGSEDLFLGDIREIIDNVVLYCVVEEFRLLRYSTEVLAQAVNVIVADGSIVDHDFAILAVVES
jgi:hypothetical protein